MRNLRAELREWNDDAPIPWIPSDGDILVGYIRKPASFDSDGHGVNDVIIEEERTGIQMSVDLAFDQLAALFELHNPRLHERIGIKCLGRNEQGQIRFVLIIDRNNPAGLNMEISSSAVEIDDMECQTTAEERDFITEMLSEDNPEVSDSFEECSERRIIGLIERNQNELENDRKALKHLETLVLGSALNDSQTDQESAVECEEDIPEQVTVESVMPVKKNWHCVWVWTLILELMALGSLATAVFYFKLPFPW